MTDENPHICPNTGKVHRIDAHSIRVDSESVDLVLSAVIDINCKDCGRSGSAVIKAKDINW